MAQGVKRELWDILDNESTRAYEAFKIYRSLSPMERSVPIAWKEWASNPDSKNPSSMFAQWSREHAWKDRAMAYDAHIERIRRKGMEAAIESEAKKGARSAEKTYNRMHELLTRGYERALERLEDDEWASQFRPQDVIQIIKLHIESAEKFAGNASDTTIEGAWTEEDDNEFANTILADLFTDDAGEGTSQDDESTASEGST